MLYRAFYLCKLKLSYIFLRAAKIVADGKKQEIRIKNTRDKNTRNKISRIQGTRIQALNHEDPKYTKNHKAFLSATLRSFFLCGSTVFVVQLYLIPGFFAGFHFINGLLVTFFIRIGGYQYKRFLFPFNRFIFFT